MGYFKDLEIDNQNSEPEDPNQLKLMFDEGTESRSMAPTASSQSLDSALTASDVPSSAYMSRNTSTAPANQPAAPAAAPSAPAEITRPGKLTVKDIRYIEEFGEKARGRIGVNSDCYSV